MLMIVQDDGLDVRCKPGFVGIEKEGSCLHAVEFLILPEGI